MPYIDLVCDDFPDGDAAGLTECLAAAERGGLFDLLREDTGTRRLLPRGVADAFLEEREAVRALMGFAESGEVAGSFVGRQRDGWRAMAAVAGAEDRDDRSDAECLVHAADNAAFGARDEWGGFLLAVGVAVGLAYGARVRDRGEGPGAATVGGHAGEVGGEAGDAGSAAARLANAVGIAADWCDDRAAVEGLRRGRSARAAG